MIAVMAAVRGSTLSPSERLIVQTVVGFGDPRTCAIPEQFRPDVDDLASATGLDRATLYRLLPKIESAGWVERRKIDGRRSVFTRAAIPGRIETDQDQSHHATETVAPCDRNSRTMRLKPAKISRTMRPDSRTMRPKQSHHATEASYISHSSLLPITPLLDEPSDEALFASPSTSSKQKKFSIDEEDRLFEEFWNAYDHKVSRIAARKAWKTAIKIKNPRVIIDAARAYRAAFDESGKSTKFMKHPDGWLRNQKWADDPSTWPHPEPSGPARAESRVPEPRRDGRSVSSPESLSKWARPSTSRNGAADA